MKQTFALMLETEDHTVDGHVTAADVRAAILHWLGDDTEELPYKFDVVRVTDVHLVERGQRKRES